MKRFIYKIFRGYFSKRTLPYWVILCFDSAIVLLSVFLAEALELGKGYFNQHFYSVAASLFLTLLFFGISFRVFHTYVGVIRYSSFVDLMKVLSATTTGSVLTFVASLVLKSLGYDIMPDLPAVLILFVFSTLLMWFERLFVKGVFDILRKDNNTQNAFVYGVRTGGVSIAKSIQNQTPQKYSLVGFVSPRGDLDTKYLLGVKVRKDGPNLIKHMQNADATVLIVSTHQIDYFRTRQNLITALIDAGIKILMVPPIEEWDGKSEYRSEHLREVEIEDLLPREKIEVDMEEIGRQLRDKVIMITGAAGSIGFEMVNQIAGFKPKKMILIDQAETPMHDVRLTMQFKYPDVCAETIVASITNKDYMSLLFERNRPDYVFHAAAYKHVPMMEDNPAIAVQNNIYGTRVIADLAVKYRTKKFVMISTDKAVNPTNVMGCSKRICEIYCQSLNKAIVEGKVEGETQFVTTRFGNVLGSNGSVIPLFKKQIKCGGPITVTHKDIIRYFMLIPEACKLVLEAGTMGKGGEIFVFDMGEPVRIVDLAKRMIALSGAKDVEIKITGLREGEKLYEEVLSDKEQTKPTIHPKIMIAAVSEYDYQSVVENEARLYEASFTFDDMAIVKIMKEIVPEYKSKQSKYEVLDA